MRPVSTFYFFFKFIYEYFYFQEMSKYFLGFLVFVIVTMWGLFMIRLFC